MAATRLSIRPVGVRACALSGDRPGVHSRKNSSGNWWTPLFGWSSEPDYIDVGNGENDRKSAASYADEERIPAKSLKRPVKFTEEKARKLRMMMMETESFHDAMYHSAIASRLASDFYDRSGGLSR